MFKYLKPNSNIMIELLKMRVGDSITYCGQVGTVISSDVTLSEIADEQCKSRFWIINEYTLLFDNKKTETFTEYNELHHNQTNEDKNN